MTWLRVLSSAVIEVPEVLQFTLPVRCTGEKVTEQGVAQSIREGSGTEARSLLRSRSVLIHASSRSHLLSIQGWTKRILPSPRFREEIPGVVFQDADSPV